MQVIVVAGFLLVVALVAVTGVAFVVNVREVGVRYVRWYRSQWAWTGGIPDVDVAKLRQAVLTGGVSL